MSFYFSELTFLTLFSGDQFSVFNVGNREWWGARAHLNNVIGYIPSAYVRPQVRTVRDRVTENERVCERERER